MVPTYRRATATAILFFFLNFIALGFGPPFTGWLIDHFASFGFAHPGTGLWETLTGAFTHAPAASDPAGFLKTCPGGAAPKGSPAALARPVQERPGVRHPARDHCLAMLLPLGVRALPPRLVRPGEGAGQGAGGSRGGLTAPPPSS